MEFIKFKESVSKIKNLELPGEEIQYKMAPIERLQELKRKALAMNSVKKAGVLALFYPDVQERAKLILILRKTYKGVHSAQVGFPGGKFEKEDTSLEQTALRETQEEIGVPKKDVTIIKQLTQMYIPPSNFIVQPFLGITQSTPNFILQETEVEALIEVGISHFMEDSVLISKKITTSYATDLTVPAYLLNNHVVWGATAMMLSEIRQLLKQVLEP
ncbi:MAG: coenzyme A pyrophosphatase [Flavobacteriaceae bacterium CG_4_8_14_3_um_filter_34_10]|nr:CoA pyrophosphatase [Flavobacteriia bacterium]OIP50189.1 MAG: coenzyme A pyrophosphatase [Flavobacteriaceae bacterium CG2_30_34_30]PIQ19026.1 MAG: coenzyme A pyrophosphatase [Flavobacteriaceae bacterium CG18_big_fil_WC_8_21_14_2_50_34_36]PIV49385.1 MAG: coenzyme A pyrophosphatase [Flavobacteriaceae bacterium CG02_land_8_20_14_3_00_34_13]PIX10577.1 MAG: coenzyme A pyrophosphatase [Flavobacteriaceae bacterium CG_4_8_14_3_um_filter_34_10]PIZ08799.1 MAG: coenzyme A pyrophosphatase [Flavobacteri